MDEETKSFIKWFFGVAVAAILLMVGLVYGWQTLKVYVAQQSGKASYAEADQNRQITIVEAVAENEAATSKALARVKIAEAEAQAEIKRAEGVAKANEIIGQGLKNNEEYLRYLWIEKVAQSDHSVVYVPADNGLPILEAGKR